MFVVIFYPEAQCSIVQTASRILITCLFIQQLQTTIGQTKAANITKSHSAPFSLKVSCRGGVFWCKFMCVLGKHAYENKNTWCWQPKAISMQYCWIVLMDYKYCRTHRFSGMEIVLHEWIGANTYPTYSKLLAGLLTWTGTCLALCHLDLDNTLYPGILYSFLMTGFCIYGTCQLGTWNHATSHLHVQGK